MLVTIISLLLVFCLLFSLLFWLFATRLEPYIHQYLINFYESSFFRYPDPVSLHYYQNLSLDIIKLDLESYKKKVWIGKEFVRSKHIILTGLIRNAQENIGFIQHFFHQLEQSFESILLLIIENNSTDDTRLNIYKWTQLDSRIHLLCPFDVESKNDIQCTIQDPLFANFIHGTHRQRIHRLSRLRNFYLDYIYTNFDWKLYSYLFIMDFDLNGQLPMDGILHTMYEFSVNESISGIACNGIVKDDVSKPHPYRYYDSFAHIDQGDPITWDTSFDKRSHDMEVMTHITDRYSKSMNLDPVTSAFGGFCIYNISHIYEKQARYSFTDSEFGRVSCEHSHFNSQLKNIYVNPRMVFHINYV